MEAPSVQKNKKGKQASPQIHISRMWERPWQGDLKQTCNIY
jgi:hypothetical protein